MVKILVEIWVSRLKNSKPHGFKGLLELLEALLLVPVPFVNAPVADSDLLRQLNDLLAGPVAVAPPFCQQHARHFRRNLVHLAA